MKSARPSHEAESSAPGKGVSIIPQARFKGTDNPRYLRAITGLMRRPLPRENLDSLAGCANGPQLVADLRELGLEVPCERVKFIDRDGRKCNPGVYSLTGTDRRKVLQWQARGLHAPATGVDGGTLF